MPKALQSNPKDRTAIYHLIQALRKTGNNAEIPDLLKRLAQLRQQAAKETSQRNQYKLVEDDPSSKAANPALAGGRPTHNVILSADRPFACEWPDGVEGALAL